MTTQIGDEIVIMSQELHQPVRKGEIRGVTNNPGGVVYVVRWSDTGDESLLQPGPDVMIRHRHGHRSEAVADGAVLWLSRLRHPLEWRHSRDLERRQQVWDAHRNEHLAGRVQDIFAGLGLTHVENSIGGGKILHVPKVVSVAAGPPVEVDIEILPGQSPEDFSAHDRTIAYDLGVAEVRVVPLGPDRIRLKLLPHDPQPGHPPASR
jgi:Domain of unknown function (DUF1918)